MWLSACVSVREFTKRFVVDRESIFCLNAIMKVFFGVNLHSLYK